MSPCSPFSQPYSFGAKQHKVSYLCFFLLPVLVQPQFTVLTVAFVLPIVEGCACMSFSEHAQHNQTITAVLALLKGNFLNYFIRQHDVLDLLMSLLVDATFNNLPYRITIPDSEFPIFCHYPLLNKDFRSFLLSKNLYSLCTLDAFCECRHCAVTKFLRMQFQFLIPQIIFHSYFLSDSTSLTFVFVIRCHRNINLYFSFKPLCTICL